MIILGLDISSFQLNACFLVDEKSPLLGVASLGKAKESIDRIDKIGPAMRWLNTYVSTDPDELVIEDAFGKSRRNDKILYAVIGACITQGRDLWPQARITIFRTLDWRRELDPDAKDNKEEGHRIVKAIVDPKWGHGTCAQLDQHELDCIGVALAWKHRLENPA